MTRIFVIFFGILICTAATAVSSKFPEDLIFLNTPVDTLCFSNLKDNSPVIHLNQCGIQQQKWVIQSQNSDLIKAGFVGFEWKDPKASFPSQGSSYYKAFEALDHQYWIYTLNNNGGSGDFTAVSLVKRKNTDTLEIKRIADGDRCNGGIQDVKEIGHHLVYSVNLTAYDFLPLAHDNPHHLKAYDDLSSCAACCVAKAFYEVDSTLKPRLKYVDLGNSSKTADMSQQGSHQACFNTRLAARIAKGESTFNDTTLKKFVKEFNEYCVK